jgi:Ca-activated chloride channel family protein
LFAGEQLVMVGRYKKSGTAKVIVRGSVGGKQQKLDFPAKLVEKSRDETFAFAEKLWGVRRVGEILEEIDLKGKNDELVKELVDLATRHGILTPYTSFLADENTPLRDVASHARRAGQRLLALDEASGSGAFYQRSFKSSLQRASQAGIATAPRATPAEAMPGGLGGFGGGRSRRSAAADGPSGRFRYDSYEEAYEAVAEGAEEELDAAVQTVRNVGNRAFYYRKGQWVDSKVTEEQEKSPVRVKQFSDEYFELARRHGRDFTQYMVFDEPVLVNLADRAYLIEP